jgi:heptosyltransferase-2
MMEGSVLIVSTNWIGDAVMGMPAIQVLREQNPRAKISILTKPGLAPLWRMHPAVDEVLLMGKSIPTSRRLRMTGYDHAYVFPNSFRSAYVPWLAGIPQRIGQRGHWRRMLLTELVAAPATDHQQFEYRAILGLREEQLPAPRLDIPDDVVCSVEQKLAQWPAYDSHKPLITLLPGAARGPSKRWPPEHFVELAKALRTSLGCNIVFGGGPDDAQACAAMVAQVGEGSLCLAGKTTIPEWAALLKLSHCVVSNDSGGMHLAAAVGTPVVAIFGITDPAKTGPLRKNIVLQKSEMRGRDIARVSEEAEIALASITPDETLAAVCSILNAEG